MTVQPSSTIRPSATDLGIITAYSLARTFQAVQWTGTPESLQAVQTLIFPGSPLYAGDLDPTDSLGIKIRSNDQRQYGIKSTLVFAKVTDWIVKDSEGDLTIYSDEGFRKGFVEPQSISTVGGTLGEGMTAVGGITQED